MVPNLLNEKKVLVVDDEADRLETLEGLLSLCHVATVKKERVRTHSQ